MDSTYVVLGVVAVGVGWWILRSRRGRSSDETTSVAHEIRRFVLRVRARSSDAGPVRIGTSSELGAVPSSVPDLTSVEAVLEDDAENLIILPAGMQLLVRQFDGARRIPLEAVTTSQGTAQRFSFDVPTEVRFWILDAPPFQQCLGTADPTRRRLPPRADGYEITTREPPTPIVDQRGHVSVTMADLTMPLWMHGLEGPEEWLLGPRPPTDVPQVAIAAFTDPFTTAGKLVARDAIVDAIPFLLVDDLWLRTAVRAGAGIPIAISHARVSTTEPLRSWEDFQPWTSRFPETTVFVWGAARADLATDGYDVRMRARTDVAEAELGGPLGTIRNEILAALAARGVARARAPRFEPIPEELEEKYLTLCDRLVLLILSHPKNEALPRQEPEAQRMIVRLANELRSSAPRSPVASLSYLVSCIYAYGCGGLSNEQRQEALRFARTQLQTAAPTDPVRRVAPAVLFRLGESGEALAACDRALAECGDSAGYRATTDPTATAYLSWLEKVRAQALKS